MKICGIIAEYNPFHEGHAYHLREAKRLSGADALVVVMSGYFVQRGEPAIYDPFVRAKSALEAGADVVFMMPPEASTASAEGFAAYGVGMLDALGCDCISCGIEGGDNIKKLRIIAAKLADEDEDTSRIIRESLKNGMSYPAALAAAAGGNAFGPNTILAVEYLKAMRRISSKMEFIPVMRVGSGYNDTELPEEGKGIYPSATALRKHILEVDGSGNPLGPDDMMWLITSRVTDHRNDLEQYADCSPEIAARIRKSRFHYKSFEQMVTDLKTKDVTYTRIARVLTHIILDIRKKDIERMNEDIRLCRLFNEGRCNAPENQKRDDDIYSVFLNAQLIGIGNTKVLSELNKRSAQKSGGRLKIISKAAESRESLKSTIYAAMTYNSALWMKYDTEGKERLIQQILKI